jgi:hypothetical protein
MARPVKFERRRGGGGAAGPAGGRALAGSGGAWDDLTGQGPLRVTVPVRSPFGRPRASEVSNFPEE